MSNKYEQKILKEIVSLFENCPRKVANYRRCKIALSATAMLLIFGGLILAILEVIDPMFCAIFALLGGTAIGLEIFYSFAIAEAPLLVRYTALREEEIRSRIEVLAKA